MNQKTFAKSQNAIKGNCSPEYLPPSAKLQKLAGNEKQSLNEGSAKLPLRVCHKLQSSQATTSNVEKTAAEKLALIREQEEKIEELMVLLESNVKKGQYFTGPHVQVGFCLDRWKHEGLVGGGEIRGYISLGNFEKSSC